MQAVYPFTHLCECYLKLVFGPSLSPLDLCVILDARLYRHILGHSTHAARAWWLMATTLF